MRLLNIEINNLNMVEFLAEFNQGIVVTPNVDHLIKLQKDLAFYQAYQKASYIVLDSRILYYTLKLLRRPVKAVIPGSDLLPAFCEYHKNEDATKIFLLGAAPGVAKQAMHNINQRVGRDIVVGAYSPSYGFEKNPEECQSIVQMINSTDANVLAIGVGAPKQEKWLAKYYDELVHIDRAMAIGATIDFEAGTVARAPKGFQKCGLEWLYRLCREPKRLWKRYLVEDIPIVILLLKEMSNLYRDPFEGLEKRQS